MTDVLVPDIGDFADVPVVEILVSPGQEVAQEDPLVTLESDKATMEIPSPAAGVVEEIVVSVGDKVSEGMKLLTLKDGEGEVADAKKDVAPESPPEPAEPAAAEKDTATEEPERDGGPPPATLTSEEAPYASPSVRRLARELRVDLAKVQGSGRKGRITKEDVQRGEAAPEPA